MSSLRQKYFKRLLSQALPLINERVEMSVKDKKRTTNTPTLISPFAPLCYSKSIKVAMSDHEGIDMLLSNEQKALVQKMHEGHNIYFTGNSSVIIL